MPNSSPDDDFTVLHRKFYFGWVVVAACTITLGLTYGLMYSYSVFFKPLADYFNWDRATVSLIYSASLIIRGAIAIGIGWLADKYGAIKISVFCGLMIGLGLILSGQVHNIWQFFLTYAVIEATGLSGAFGIGTAVVSRWFIKKRGLALGIVSTGSGLGTLLIVPGAERLVNAFGWSLSFVICGAVAGVLMIGSAFFMRPAPKEASLKSKTGRATGSGPVSASSPEGVTLRDALRSPKMLLLLGAFLLFFFCVQITMVHLVNFATDTGITPLVAATFISLIGAVSIAGRLTTGLGAERFGINNSLILTRVFLAISFILLIFTRSTWMFYLFAVVFGFTYGGEVPQIPLFIGKFFGIGNMATLVGLTIFIGNIGGAVGPWVAGEIFDTTHSYQWAFIAGAIAAVVSLWLAFILKRQSSKE